jgi:hypothetical protein
VACPAGTYNPNTGGTSAASCLTSPAGYYTNAATTTPSLLCRAGYYCPSGSRSATPFACPVRTYNKYTGRAALEDCAICATGYYCASPATVNPTQCPAGSYCELGSVNPENCPAGTFGDGTKFRQKEDCADCTPGMYCATSGLTAPTGLCSQGFYCILGAKTPTSSDDVNTGGVCPAGGYCPVGSAVALPCPAGTFSNVAGQFDASQCGACSVGFYCAGTNLNAPTGPCDPGYYCSGGSSTPTQFITQAGYYSAAGAATPAACLPGTYNPQTAQETCTLCPAGYTCLSSAMTALVDCPRGQYCLKGNTTNFQPVPCPLGTFSVNLNLQTEAACTDCTPGEFCGLAGQTTTSGPCAAGYFCASKSASSTPADGATAGRCPQGHFCGVGTHTPTACLAGTMNTNFGSSTIAACADCAGGSYCATNGLAAVTGPCDAGFYCIRGAVVAAVSPDGATGGICPVGFACPVGSSAPVACIAGTYSNVQGATACLTCEGGYFCAGGTNKVDCPAGAYCPPGSTNANLLCPAGTFSASTRLDDVTDCTSCTAGFYCAGTGMIAVGPACPAKFYCPLGASAPLGPCPMGRYCPAGDASSPIACPPGTYGATIDLGALASCIDAPAGKYVLGSAQTAVTGDCAAGYWCATKQFSSTPAENSNGGQCPPGYSCLLASGSKLACLAGTYQDEHGAASCKTCPESYFCPGTSTDFLSNPCPAGYWCPLGSTTGTQNGCPTGTFSSNTLLKAQIECVKASAGSYVDSVAARAPTAQCEKGYYCTGGAIKRNPVIANGDVGGDRCPAGGYW